MKLRFATVPAGLLHIGNARLALVNWLLARRHDARFVLRLDDIDAERCPPEALESTRHDLSWFGLDWDEEVRQSERAPRYATAIEKLKATGRLYPCFESEEELNAKRDQRLRRGLSAIYDRAMLKLTEKQRSDAEAGGKRPYWRFRLSPLPAEWGDMVLGRQAVKLSAMSDPVLVRADGTPLHALTAAVDDIALGITHAVHGDDHLGGTGIQIDIMAALGARPHAMRFAHLPLMTDTRGGKLARRTGLSTLRSLRGDGVEPASLSGMLARLGTPDAPAAEPPALLASRYDLSRVAPEPPRYDPARLLTLNRAVLATLPFEAVRDRLPPAATPAFWQSVRGSLDLLREARGWWDVVGGSIVPPLIEGEAGFLHQALDALPPEPWDPTTFALWTAALHGATGRSDEALLLPLRLALTGEDHGPDLADLLPLIGRARAADRLALAAA